MPGLVPGIRLCTAMTKENGDGRDEPGHDGKELGQWPTWQTKAEGNRSFTID